MRNRKVEKWTWITGSDHSNRIIVILTGNITRVVRISLLILYYEELCSREMKRYRPY